MYQIIWKNRDKLKYFFFTIITITLLLLVTVVYKNDQIATNKQTNISLPDKDLKLIKEFFLKKINSPFINLDYEIKKGDSIQKILKKLKVKNTEIQTVINQYKKYSNPNQLLTGNRIEIIVEKNLSKNDNSVIKFSVPISRSTTIQIAKDDLGEIRSEKIITKLFKRIYS